MNQLKNKQIYLSHYTDILEKNMKILQGYEYVYTGSIILFLRIADRGKLPDDIDVAINRNEKTVDDLKILYKSLLSNEEAKNVKIKTIYKKTYVVKKISYDFQKYQTIDIENMPHELLEKMFEDGDLRLSYLIDNMAIEIFPEKNGNGLTNLGVMNKKIVYQTVKTDKNGTITVPLLSHKAIAQGYAMNFLKEIIRNNIYRFTDQNSKVKDGMRLFSIISLLDKQGEDASPEGVLKFITATVNEYKKLPEQHRSKYINGDIKEFPRIKKMMQEIIKEYHIIIKKKGQ